MQVKQRKKKNRPNKKRFTCWMRWCSWLDHSSVRLVYLSNSSFCSSVKLPITLPSIERTPSYKTKFIILLRLHLFRNQKICQLSLFSSVVSHTLFLFRTCGLPSPHYDINYYMIVERVYIFDSVSIAGPR